MPHLCPYPPPPPLRLNIDTCIKEDLRKELERYVNLGVLEPVDEPTPWVSSVAVATKKSGALRICIDPRPLNKALKRETYQLTVLDEILPDLAKAKVFSTADLRSGYWHCVLDEESSLLTTFATPYGRYRWCRLPFGLSVSSEIFQKRVNQALEGLNGVLDIVDDILIYGVGDSTEEADADHDKNLEALLQRCRERGMALNKDKLKLKRTEVPFMGHVLTDQGVKIDPEKVKAVQEMPKPEDVEGVQRLNGFVNYLAKFLPRLADEMEPMRRLTRKDTEWKWTEEQDKAFDTVKKLLTEAPVLRYYDPGRELEIQCDASQRGLGATLLQEGKPIVYAKFGSSQQKEPLMPHEVPSRPWEKVGTDIFEHDSKEYLITVDYYSNFWEVDRLPDTRASSVILKLKNHFARHGCPDQLVSDNGPQFSSEKFEQFAQAWEFEHCTSSPGNSKANGKAESAVKTAKRILRKALDAGTDPYVAILDYRNTPTQGMESSPAQRLMNRRTKTLLPTKKTLLQPRVVQHDREKKQLIKRQEQQTQFYNRGVKELPTLSEGDVVRMKPFRLGDKNWRKAIVTERLDQRSYTVETPDGGTYRRNRYHLRKRKESPPVQELPELDQPPVELQPQTTSQAPSPGRREPEPTKLAPSKTSADKTAPSCDPAPREQRPTRTRRAPAYLADYVRY